MENFQVYRDIQARTGGDIYIGVVGLSVQENLLLYADLWKSWHYRRCQRVVRQKSGISFH